MEELVIYASFWEQRRDWILNYKAQNGSQVPPETSPLPNPEVSSITTSPPPSKPSQLRAPILGDETPFLYPWYHMGPVTW